MNDKIWKIELLNGEDISVTCEQLGVATDGSLLCFDVLNQQPVAIRGYAPGQWKSFYKSTLRMN